MIGVMPSVFIFANPIAGRGKGSLFARKIQQSLIRRGWKVRVKLCPPSQCDDQTLAEISSADAVIAIGGDGTLRGVASDIIRRTKTKKCPPLLIVPLGTANLMGKHLGIKWKPETLGRDVAAALEQNRLQHVDAATLRSDGDGMQEQLLLLVAGIGIDGRVVHELAKIRRGPISYASYALPTALALGGYRFPAINVSVDSESVFAGRGIALVGNVREYGTGFSVLPHARANDGLLDICAMPCRNMAELIKLFILAATGMHLSSRGVVYATGKKIEITSAEPVEVQVDGDAAGWTPVHIEIMNEKLVFVLPPQ
ncbi:MAG TPA: diacylglycerol kinase family protein [Tepidisphaeraceae bacterium]|nr:diacylglycerol kinase family protein [Tepidisphaeraceae bacterium]